MKNKGSTYQDNMVPNVLRHRTQVVDAICCLYQQHSDVHNQRHLKQKGRNEKKNYYNTYYEYIYHYYHY